MLSLALGIGANTALFSILNGLIIKQLPVREPEQLVVIDRTSWPNPVWEQIAERQHDLFESAGAWSPESFNLAAAGRVDPVSGAYVSGGLFHSPGVESHAGRTIAPADDARGGGPDGPVAVISFDSGGPGSAARRTSSGGSSRSTVCTSPLPACSPKDSWGRKSGGRWTCFCPRVGSGHSRTESDLNERDSWWLQLVARLRPGQSLEQAAAALNAAMPAIRAATIRGDNTDRTRYSPTSSPWSPRPPVPPRPTSEACVDFADISSSRSWSC